MQLRQACGGIHAGRFGLDGGADLAQPVGIGGPVRIVFQPGGDAAGHVCGGMAIQVVWQHLAQRLFLRIDGLSHGGRLPGQTSAVCTGVS